MLDVGIFVFRAQEVAPSMSRGYGDMVGKSPWPLGVITHNLGCKTSIFHGFGVQG